MRDNARALQQARRRPGYGVVPPTRRKGYTRTEDGCWLYDGFKDRDGYGFLNTYIDGRSSSQMAHRFFYELWVGPVPRDMELDHRCESKSCVNPQHLDIVTHDENMRRNAARSLRCRNGHLRSKHGVYVTHLSSGRVLRTCRTCAKKTKRVGYATKKKAQQNVRPPTKKLSKKFTIRKKVAA